VDNPDGPYPNIAALAQWRALYDDVWANLTRLAHWAVGQYQQASMPPRTIDTYWSPGWTSGSQPTGLTKFSAPAGAAYALLDDGLIAPGRGRSSQRDFPVQALMMTITGGEILYCQPWTTMSPGSRGESRLRVLQTSRLFGPAGASRAERAAVPRPPRRLFTLDEVTLTGFAEIARLNGMHPSDPLFLAQYQRLREAILSYVRDALHRHSLQPAPRKPWWDRGYNTTR
jgi:hypothetical protein